MKAGESPKARRTEEGGQPAGPDGRGARVAGAQATARTTQPAHEHDLLSWETVEEVVEVVDEIFTLPELPDSRWHRKGLGDRGTRVFERVSSVVLLLLAIGWTWTVATAATRADLAADEPGALPVSVSARLSSALSTPGTPAVAYLTDAAVAALVPLRGESGRLRARFQQGDQALPVDSLPAGASVAIASGGDTVTLADSAGGSAAGTRARPGLWGLVVRAGNVIKPVADMTVIPLVPATARRNGRIGLYYIGSWPTERSRGRVRPNYEPPSGFIEVTRENQDTYVSEHFRLRDFLTKDQGNVWPKYLVLESRLLDKLELVMTELQRQGYRTKGVRVMSGFRTPQYNRGGGNTAGRAELSRHMYGDASDIYIDNDGNGVMDDLNKDGRVTIADARIILAAIERVEREHPALVGGAGVYTAGPGHGPFIHVDTRGYRARWVGSGD